MQQHVFTIAQTCEAAGIEHAIICPGSRSAPLVYAFSRSAITCSSVVDERSAGYMALGMAQQTGKPVVLICTSGTAAVNFFPAITEAFYQQVPLLVLTADRPPELLNQQDGQMIDQQNLYGSHVKYAQNLHHYVEGTENHKEVRSIVIDALQQAVSGAKGPVHLNIPLSEPLYPQGSPTIPVTQSFPAPVLKSEYTPMAARDVEWMENVWTKAHKKLVLVGQMPCHATLTTALFELSKDGNTVIVCDVLSNQFDYNTAPFFDYVMMRADAPTLQELEPDCIVSLGGPVLSKPFKKWMKQLKPAHHIRFNEADRPVDTYQNTTRAFVGDAAPVLFHLALNTPRVDEPSRYKTFWQLTNRIVASAAQRFLGTGEWNELSAVHYLMHKMPDAVNLQIGNSSVIRYISYFGHLKPSWVMNGNRGTSGIDGCTSTAVGAALVNNRPTFLLTGDIAFLYDANALWNGLPANLKIVVLNNEGGGIFQLIDGPSNHKKELPYFTTPHRQNIGAWAMAKGIKHVKVTSIQELSKATTSFFDPSTPGMILEIMVDRNQNAEAFKRFRQFPL